MPTVVELKLLCEKYKLPKTGNKAALIERLKPFMTEISNVDIYEEPKENRKIREAIIEEKKRILKSIGVVDLSYNDMLKHIRKLKHIDVYRYSDGYHLFDEGKHYHYSPLNENDRAMVITRFAFFEKELFSILSKSSHIKTFIYQTMLGFNHNKVFLGIQPTLEYLDLPDYSDIDIKKMLESNPTCKYDSMQTSSDKEYVGNGHIYNFGDYTLNFLTKTWTKN